MKQIQKAVPPKAIIRYMNQPGLTWGGCKVKPEVRSALYKEQFGLCAYCLSTLNPPTAIPHPAPIDGGMKIEHWKARNEAGISAAEQHKRSFDWMNLLGVCPGGVKRRPANGVRLKIHSELYCDAFRDTSLLARNPADPSQPVEHLFTLSSTGELSVCDSLNNIDRLDADGLLTKLNLNAPALVELRAAALKAVVPIHPSANRSVSDVLNELSQPDSQGALPAFCTLIQDFLDRSFPRGP